MKLFHRQYGNGKPVVILHGLFGMSDNWVTIGKKLAEHNYSVFIPDQRNHGNSPHSSKFNFNLLCKDLKEFLEQNQIEKPLIIGHSMGGKVAMLFALNYPENVEKLIVVDMGVKKYPVPNEILIDALFAKSLGNFKSRKEIEDYLTEKIHDLGIRQLILKNIYSNSNKSYKWKSNISGIKNNFDLIFEPIESKNTFLNPTLFIRGELSNYILDEDIAGIKKLFPTSQFETIKMASHWVQADKPKELVDLIIEFVKL